ncbi:electron transport complex protein RnfB [Sphaerotilus hippei]|uniref:Electron transport complex protein RnfB n=1 Tax=Sphaerotilus hippei TaxID=744406 RepID=A0A318H541_9BURK|nr:electron transport complex subunit RsxB [Sphaerotilus hippei]PXW98527.1 electron transport complex protein RnfB [Sphaerotilus hippei]
MTPTVEQIDQLLPQTQCTRCGYPDCRSYAQAIAQQRTEINRCPPGGQLGIERLAALTGRPVLPLDPESGAEGPRHVAVIDEHWCIGCTLCIKACPVDCIVGTHKMMHTVIEAECTGCELCIPACPVDCISLDNVSGERTGWQAWSAAEAESARQRHLDTLARRQVAAQRHAQALERKAEHKLAHLETLTRANTPDELERKRSVIEAALARARSRRQDPT